MTGGIPKYVAVRENLRQRVQSMSPGDKLPAEPELCDRYGVSRITLRHAVDDLIGEGLLVREQGRGTFRTSHEVRDEREVISDHIRGFYRQQASLGNVVHTVMLGNGIVHDPDVALRLGLSDDAALIRLERLRYVGETLRQHVVTYLSAERFPLVAEHDFSEGSLYDFLERHYAVRLVENEVVVRMQAVDAAIARHFGVRKGTVVLAMDSTVIDEFGSIIAFGTALQTPDQGEIKFIIRSQKDFGPVQG